MSFFTSDVSGDIPTLANGSTAFDVNQQLLFCQSLRENNQHDEEENSNWEYDGAYGAISTSTVFV